MKASSRRRQFVCCLGLVVLFASSLSFQIPQTRAKTPDGHVTWGVATSIVPAWFDPAETAGIATPFMVLYALHDAMVKPMPGDLRAPALAESWTVSSDGLLYDFVLRRDVRFHNGDLLTAEDVQFSFERYRGTAERILKDRVAAVEVVSPRRVRFRLRRPWADFLVVYSNSTGAGWVVPKKYVERVGEDGFKKAPIGAGPYKFVSFTAGVELVMEAFNQYWRKRPSVERLVFRVIPDESTRLAALKRGEIDIAYGLGGESAGEVRRTSGLTLHATVVPATAWVYFADQWNVKSPWYDRRVRVAANLAINREGINQAQSLGFAKVTWSLIPSSFDFYWQPPAYPYDPPEARHLLTEAGYDHGFDAGDYFCDMEFCTIGEAVVNDLKAVGIRAKLRPLERATFFKEWREKKLNNLIQGGSGALGNAATRIEAFVASGGTYVYGSYPDIDRLFLQQVEVGRGKRSAILQRIQQLISDKVVVAPIQELAVLTGIGPRVEQPALGLIAGYPFSMPYEDVKLKTR